MADTTGSPSLSPDYSRYRSGVAAVDTLPVTNKRAGINMSGYLKANIQVLPSGGANPTVAVLWWSELAGKYVREFTPISKGAVGADTPFEFSVDCLGRFMLVAVTTLAAGTVDIGVSGFDREHGTV